MRNRTCSNCGNREGAICYDCAGDNDGQATEVSPGGYCWNWRPDELSVPGEPDEGGGVRLRILPRPSLPLLYHFSASLSSGKLASCP